MVISYFVYAKGEDRTPIISSEKLPLVQFKSKPKWIGKKAKIEAIFRYTKVRLLSTLETKHINDYINENFYNTSRWGEYLEVFKSVCNERHLVPENYTYLYQAEVEIDDNLNCNAVKESIINDDRLVYLLTNELMGDHLSHYNGLDNPIIKYTKKYPENA